MNRIFFLLTFLSLLSIFTDEVFTQDNETNKEVISKSPVENRKSGSNGSGGSTIILNQTNNNTTVPIRKDLTDQSTISESGSANVNGINKSSGNDNRPGREIILLDLRKFSDDNQDQVPDGWATNISTMQFTPEGEYCLTLRTKNISEDNYFNYMYETIPNVYSYAISLETNIPLNSIIIEQYTSMNEKLEEKNLIENLSSSHVIAPFHITANTSRILVSIQLPQGLEVIIKNLFIIYDDDMTEVQDEND